MSSDPSELRAAALEGYLTRQEAAGYRIETRTRMQAVIVRRGHPLHVVVRWFGSNRFASRRLVVSVDEYGSVTSVAAEPVRW